MPSEDMKTADTKVYDGIERKAVSIDKLSESELAASHSSIDPLASRVRQSTPEEEEAHLAATIKAKKGTLHTMPPAGMSLTGTADPMYAHGFQIKDRVYHKLKKKEGVIKDVAASGKIQLEFDSGTTAWCNKDNLVKL